MRTFQLLYVLLFVLFYAFISFGAIKSLTGIAKPKNKIKSLWITLIISIAIITGFIFLYIWPFTPRSTKEYSTYLIYNAVLSADFVFKISLTLSFITGLFFHGKSKTVIYLMGFIFAIGMGSSIIYGTLFGRNSLQVNEIELEYKNLPKNYNGIRILQISDTHLGSFLGTKRLMQKVGKETLKIRPDIILFSGDLVNNFSQELEGWKPVFDEITKNCECYSILGNHDYGNYSDWENETEKNENFRMIIDGHKDFGFKLLNNEHVKLKSGNDSIYIIGVENWGHPPFPQYANLEKALNGIPSGAFKIFMTHDPAHWNEVIKNRGDVDLTLSGHTHGFQWGIKRVGITFSLSYLTRENWGGLYQFKNSRLYVNTGLGTVGLPWRINMPGEITLITLKRVEID